MYHCEYKFKSDLVFAFFVNDSNDVQDLCYVCGHSYDNRKTRRSDISGKLTQTLYRHPVNYVYQFQYFGLGSPVSHNGFIHNSFLAWTFQARLTKSQDFKRAQHADRLNLIAKSVHRAVCCLSLK